MFDFSGKGKTGLFGGGNVQHQAAPIVKTVTETIHARITDPVDNQPKNVHFWADCTIQLRAAFKKVSDMYNMQRYLALDRFTITQGPRYVLEMQKRELEKLDPKNPMLDPSRRNFMFMEAVLGTKKELCQELKIDTWDSSKAMAEMKID